mgnify:CR=1 FL=1
MFSSMMLPLTIYLRTTIYNYTTAHVNDYEQRRKVQLIVVDVGSGGSGGVVVVVVLKTARTRTIVVSPHPALCRPALCM